jgi:hypothetical protein
MKGLITEAIAVDEVMIYQEHPNRCFLFCLKSDITQGGNGMRIETLQIEHLEPNGWNPNEMDDHIYNSLVESSRKHGVLQPILVRSNMTIVKGEKRWRTAKEVGSA